jgi:hypothetical protein
MLKSTLLLGAGIAIGAGAIHGLHAATGPSVYVVYEANIADEAAYTKDLPDVQKIIKETGGNRIAGGFNKAKASMGKPPENRFVIVQWPDMAAWEKGWNGGIKEWVEKHAPNARQVLVEGVEAK